MSAMNDELPRIQEQVYYGQINSRTDVLDKFLSESGIQRYNPQVLVIPTYFCIINGIWDDDVLYCIKSI